MKKLLIILFFLLSGELSYAQALKTGEYSSGLRLVYDKKTNKLTGYFESYSGWDEETKNPKFACIFCIEGSVKGKKFKITTYYPYESINEIIEGTMELLDSSRVAISLPEEHGGCWNVEHFADKEAAIFSLEKEQNWIRTSYITKEKAFFYKERSPDKKQKAYLVKGDLLCVDKIEGEWAHCTYFGPKTTSGWMLSKDIK